MDGGRLHAPARLCAVRLVVRVSAPYRNTALHLASREGHTQIVKALLEKGSDVNAEDNAKCVFSCGLCWTGAGCTRRQGCAQFGSW